MGCGVSKMDTDGLSRTSQAAHRSTHAERTSLSPPKKDSEQSVEQSAASTRSGSNEVTDVPDVEGQQQFEAAPRWRKGGLLGKGRFGDVYCGMMEVSGELIAVKCIPFDRSHFKDSRKELQMLMRLKDPHVVQYRGCDIDTTGNRLWILMEWVPSGSVRDLVEKVGHLEESLVARFAYDALQGLAFLHRSKVVHGDVQTGNLLIDGEGGVKLSDFGTAVWSKGGERGGDGEGRGEEGRMEERLSGSRGRQDGGKNVYLTAPYFIAPEVAREEGAIPASDIWSWAGCVLHMATGHPPFAELGFDHPIPLLLHIGNLGNGEGESRHTKGSSGSRQRVLGLDSSSHSMDVGDDDGDLDGYGVTRPPETTTATLSSTAAAPPPLPKAPPRVASTESDGEGAAGDSTGPQLPGGISRALQELLQACFVPNPADRPTAEALLGHEFFHALRAQAVDGEKEKRRLWRMETGYSLRDLMRPDDDTESEETGRGEGPGDDMSDDSGLDRTKGMSKLPSVAFDGFPSLDVDDVTSGGHSSSSRAGKESGGTGGTRGKESSSSAPSRSMFSGGKDTAVALGSIGSERDVHEEPPIHVLGEAVAEHLKQVSRQQARMARMSLEPSLERDMEREME